jgi:hypothetical protein
MMGEFCRCSDRTPLLADRNLSVSNELVRSDSPIERMPKLLTSNTKASLVTGNWGIASPMPSFVPGIATFTYTPHAHSLVGRLLYLVFFPGIVVCHKLYPMFRSLYRIRLYPTVHYTSPLYLFLFPALMMRMRVICIKYETTFLCHCHCHLCLAGALST